MSQAQYLQDQSDEGAGDHREERLKDSTLMRERYDKNKLANVGSFIECANCNKKILKKSYQKQFCSNKGRKNCKDQFWNTVDEDRNFRAKMFKV